MGSLCNYFKDGERCVGFCVFHLIIFTFVPTSSLSNTELLYYIYKLYYFIVDLVLGCCLYMFPVLLFLMFVVVC